MSFELPYDINQKVTNFLDPPPIIKTANAILHVNIASQPENLLYTFMPPEPENPQSLLNTPFYKLYDAMSAIINKTPRPESIFGPIGLFDPAWVNELTTDEGVEFRAATLVDYITLRNIFEHGKLIIRTRPGIENFTRSSIVLVENIVAAYYETTPHTFTVEARNLGLGLPVATPLPSIFQRYPLPSYDEGHSVDIKFIYSKDRRVDFDGRPGWGYNYGKQKSKKKKKKSGKRKTSKRKRSKNVSLKKKMR